MNPHPLAALLPALDDAALHELAVDIKEHGLRDPIMTLDGLVLDGRNRLRACELAGVEPRFIAFSGADPLAYVASMNLYRRHLNESQRALVAARVIEIYERAPDDASPADRAAIGASVGLPIGRGTRPTVGQLADITNVGARSIGRAKQVIRDAVPEVVAAVERGTMAVSVAADLAKKTPEKQREELANPPARRTAVSRPLSDDVLKAERFEKALDELLGDYLKSTGLLRQAQNNALDATLPLFARARKESR